MAIIHQANITALPYNIGMTPILYTYYITINTISLSSKIIIEDYKGQKGSTKSSSAPTH